MFRAFGGKHRHVALDARGVALSQLGNKSEATQDFRDAIQNNHTYVSAWINLGNIQRGEPYSGNYAPCDAISSYTRATEIDPKYPGWLAVGELFLNAANSRQANKTNDRDQCFANLSASILYRRAEDSFRTALEVAPNFAQPYMQMGILYNEQHRFRDAATYFTKASEIDGYNIYILQRQAQNYLQMKNLDGIRKATFIYCRLIGFGEEGEQSAKAVLDAMKWHYAQGDLEVDAASQVAPQGACPLRPS